MKSDTLLMCVLATMLGHYCWQSTAYTATQNGGRGVEKTLETPLNAITRLMRTVSAARPALSPSRDDLYLQEMSVRRVGSGAEHKFGDELMRTLSSEIDTEQELDLLSEEPDNANTVFSQFEEANQQDILQKLERDLNEERDIATKSTLLMKLLEDPTIETLPVVYVEEAQVMQPTGELTKRSRYYRRYPWKRHNRNRSTYEPELRYACTPTKEDVFKLLLNLHENRKGNHSKTVNFCNRKRPAKAIFTNIRFLG